MKSIMKYAVTAMLILASVSVFGQKSQKFGHINSADLLEMMPEIKANDAKLAAYQKQLEQQNEAMLGEYQTKGAEYQKLRQAPGDNEVKIEILEQELKDLETRITTFQQGAPEKLSAKKEELYAPILDKAKKAIQDVSKANGYTYVFDTSLGILIHFPDSDDIMALVKKELAIK